MNEYLRQQILTSTPDQIFLLLLTECLVILNIEPINTDKVIDILLALSDQLNTEIENEFIDDLYALFNRMIFRLIEYNINKDEDIIISLENNLSNIIDAWKVRIKN